MNISIIKSRLSTYHCKIVEDQENALKEIMQEIALLGLSRAGFFRIAAFQGGTCLRILYDLERFSEDLDFVLESPDKKFNWEKYVHNLSEEFNAYGFKMKIKNRSKLENSVKMAFLKADSEGGLLIINDMETNKLQLRIKLEIDTNPPKGSKYELKYLNFPAPCSIKSQDLSSLFAGKCHALLCRNYIKGRDWYDFIWYITRKTPINFELLHYSIAQAGPWKEKNIMITKEWFLQELKIKICAIDWEIAKKDVSRFLKERELSTLELWSKEFFLSCLEKLSRYLD